MYTNIHITVAGTPYTLKPEATYEVLTFPSGEVHVRIRAVNLGMLRASSSNEIVFEVYDVKTPTDVLIVQLLRNALINVLGHAINLKLIVHYFPSARQDRVAVEGDANSAMVYGKLLTKGFNSVLITDPHSLVSEMFSRGGKNISQKDVLVHGMRMNTPQLKGELINLAHGHTKLIAPDIGALKKTQEIGKRFLKPEMIADMVVACHKVRNPVNGDITSYSVLGDVKGFDCLITDDICDGGFTFTSCADLLYLKGAKSVALYVTHGLFTKGFQGLKDSGITHIYTTNSTCLNVPPDFTDYVSVIDLANIHTNH